MLIVEFEGPPPWSVDHASKTGESTNCPWVWVVVRARQVEKRVRFFSDSKKVAKPGEKSRSSDVCRLCGINFKILVSDFGRKNKYWYISTKNLFNIPERAGVDKIRLTYL